MDWQLQGVVDWWILSAEAAPGLDLDLRAFVVRRALFGLIVVGLAIVVWRVIVGFLPDAPHPDPKAIFFAMFEDRIRIEFPGQSAAELSTLLAGVYSILRPAPQRPCVLLLLFQRSAAATALGLAHAAAAAVQTALVGWPAPKEEIQIEGTKFSDSNDYNNLNAILNKILKSVIILLLDLGERFAQQELQCQPAVLVAERYLTDSWQRGWESIRQSTLTDLLSKLTDRALIVFAESEVSVDSPSNM